MITRFCKILFPIVLVYITIHFTLFKFKLNLNKINDNDFLFLFIGLILGFSITLFPFIVSLTEQLKIKAVEKFKDNCDKKLSIEKNIQNMFTEVKHNILFIFSTLVIVSVLYILNNLNYPEVNNILGEFFEIGLVLKSIRLTVFILNLYSIYDLIIVSFALSNSNTILGVE